MGERRQQLGTYGERLAEKRYLQAGYDLIERNFRCRLGEIDLIFQKEDTLYFVEVRTKSNLAYGSAEESVTNRKIKTIHKVSQYFMKTRGREKFNVQYDFVAVYIDKLRKKAWIKRYPAAF